MFCSSSDLSILVMGAWCCKLMLCSMCSRAELLLCFCFKQTAAALLQYTVTSRRLLQGQQPHHALAVYLNLLLLLLLLLRLL
jgi:hypothetical protein